MTFRRSEEGTSVDLLSAAYRWPNTSFITGMLAGAILGAAAGYLCFGPFGGNDPDATPAISDQEFVSPEPEMEFPDNRERGFAPKGYDSPAETQ
jgi:hypothetical protein